MRKDPIFLPLALREYALEAVVDAKKFTSSGADAIPSVKILLSPYPIFGGANFWLAKVAAHLSASLNNEPAEQVVEGLFSYDLEEVCCRRPSRCVPPSLARSLAR